LGEILLKSVYFNIFLEIESEEEDRYLEVIRTEVKKEGELREKETTKKKKN
jgi:hypothetical protein